MSARIDTASSHSHHIETAALSGKPGIHRHPRHAVVIASGGLDSTVLAYWLHARGTQLTLLSFDYGQRHRVELRYAAAVASALETRHEVVDLSALGRVLGGSALTDSGVGVPDGHYTDETMRATVVPNRNAIMLDIAVAMAVVTKADAVAFGAHAGDHPIYPDCRESFTTSFARTAHVANEGFLPSDFQLVVPFLANSKTDIVRLGAALGVPFEQTWSCYRGGAQHCGTCGTCTERREAFRDAGVTDPTTYAVRDA
ncbi:7-cyano-7-deazaguanine synthase QueC [Pseudonocardia sp. C8]|uniref:7-cyano-7-deazaguanine synthase n=1 Tax=Saccharopolyspora cebuensis TaxID=418759 RepID=A0ABV4CN40_9PSEU|nr:7-cyano-7-deazaguanine synthase QueC [Pseudonocardia sp. C8]MBC3194007.1 7-cyano-7-deazaguanine synthase QueC [Pseudonocardia sp. C8]